MSVKENIEHLRSSIPEHVLILAATKTRTTGQIKEAIDSGIGIFGENYVQEAENKYAEIRKNNDIELYFIGHLQKNKVNKALRTFDVINIDSFEIAYELNKRSDKKTKVLIEVNIGNEPQKHGCKPEELIELIKKLSELKNIEIKGLMAMAPYFKDAEKTRPYFREMKLLFDKINSTMPDVKIDILSLGMTNDYKIAIEEGSNLIRIGSLIFG
jgi:pyridoxal phosphate enzyme (YggS family)